MPATKIDIYNAALAHVGQETALTSETEDSTQRRILDRFYSITVERHLYSIDWPFARAFATLATVAGTPPVGWQYQYQRPGDCLRPVYILGEARTWHDRVPFETATIGGTKLILTNREFAELAYTRNDVTEADFDPGFVDLVALALAVRIALPIAADGRIKSALEADYRVAYAQAISASMRERIGEPNRNPESINDLSEVRF